MGMKLLSMLALLLGAAFAGLSVNDWTLSQESYRPGSNGVMELEISNPMISGFDIKAVNAVDIDIVAPPEIVVASDQFVGDIEPGGTTKISLPFRVLPSADSGIYSVELKLFGRADRPTGGFDTFSKRVTIPVTVVNEPNLILSTGTQVIGGLDEVTLTLVNNGGKATNVKIRTSEASPVSLYGTDAVFIQAISGNASALMTLDSRGAADGPTDVPFTIEYEDELGIRKSVESSLRMTVRNEKLDLSFAQQSDVITKKESTLALTITNDGSTGLRDVRLSFPDDMLRIKGSGELKFGDLAPGESATSSATVFAEIAPGVKLVSGELSWIEKDVQKSESRQVPITITSDADVGVYLEAKPLPLTAGSDHTISVLVSNLGSYAIENVDVRLVSPALKSLDISESQYIGGLQNDDFSTVQFLMKVNATGEGTYPVDIIVNYRDQSGDWKQRLVTQNISVYSQPAAEVSPLPLLGAIALAGAAVWYVFLRKRNNAAG